MKNDIVLEGNKFSKDVSIQLPISKSECNRALILSHISHGNIRVKEISNSEDTQTLVKLLSQLSSATNFVLDCGPAGTTFRFLTSLLAITEGEYLLTGSQRMKERPIGELVNALNHLGAEITYTENEGFPPLKIKGKKLKGGDVSLNPTISSQFVSSLMLIGSQFENGLTIKFNEEPVSFPYIEMTASLLRECGITIELSKKNVGIPPQKFREINLNCERDWSAASYFYSMVAIKNDLKIVLPGLKENSIQGDSVVQKIFEIFGVVSVFENSGVTLYNNQSVYTDFFEYDFSDCPDLAQTLAFTCAALKIPAQFIGLSTLRNKETDRIKALQNELKKMGVETDSTQDSLSILKFNDAIEQITFETYDDHRMAMAAAPIVLLNKKITIKDKTVVGKSFPEYWNEVKKITI